MNDAKKKGLTHLTSKGEAHMVDVGAKTATARRAVARARVTMAAETGAWDRSEGLDHQASALRTWYLELAEAIRRAEPAPPAQRGDVGGQEETLRRSAQGHHEVTGDYACGSRTRNVVPDPGVDCTSISPSCICTVL